MFPFLKMKKNFIIYSFILLLIIPIFGFNFLLSLIGNVLLLIILIPILIFLIALVGFNSFTSKVKTCNVCGTISLGINNTCMNCGANLGDINEKNLGNINKPSEATIEIKADEIK